MPLYRIYRMKDACRQQFRWAPHSIGATAVKPRDYEEDGAVEAPSAYAAWAALRDSSRPLSVGDLLGAEGTGLRIYKYVGFEEAHWLLPEVKTGLETLPAAAGEAGPPPARA